MKLFQLLLSISLTVGLFGQPNSAVLSTLLAKNKDALGPAGENPEVFEVQIVYTQIDRDKDNTPSFESHFFNVDESRYFYPASTVKMPAALVALEKMHELNIPGLDRNAIMLSGHGPPPQTAMLYDSSAKDNLPTLAHYIKHVFIVSDNNSNNRMYEWCGQEFLNNTLREKGLNHSRIVHRIGISGFDAPSNRITNPITFLRDNKLIHHQPLVQSEISIEDYNKNLTHLQRGQGYTTESGKLIREPFDFSKKNFLSLPDLTGILQRILFPNSFVEEHQFNIDPTDYSYLYKCMSIHPSESAFPAYPGKADSYVKFLMYGDEEQEIPDHIRIFNKVGWAYGFLTDVAYIIDTKNKVEFMLSATIHTNANQIYNDGIYEIEEIAMPFLAGLGSAVYDHELKRKRKHAPDLSRFTNIRYN